MQEEMCTLIFARVTYETRGEADWAGHDLGQQGQRMTSKRSDPPLLLLKHSGSGATRRDPGEQEGTQEDTQVSTEPYRQKCSWLLG